MKTQRQSLRPSKTVAQGARQRVLDRIRTAIADGNDAEAMRIARELQRRWQTCEQRRHRPTEASGHC